MNSQTQTKKFPWGDEENLETAKTYVTQRLSAEDIDSTIAFLSGEVLFAQISGSRNLVSEACASLIEVQLSDANLNELMLARLLQVADGASDDNCAKKVLKWAYDEKNPSANYVNLQKSHPGLCGVIDILLRRYK